MKTLLEHYIRNLYPENDNTVTHAPQYFDDPFNNNYLFNLKLENKFIQDVL